VQTATKNFLRSFAKSKTTQRVIRSLQLLMINRFQYLHQLLEAAPNDTFVLFALAKEYEKQQEPALALEYYLRLKNTDPDYVGLYYHLGKLYEQKNDYPNAIQTYKDGIAVSRRLGDMHAASELGGALLNIEDPEDA
jgi:tetratricopeptide (TPR) repeat protein